MTEKEELDLYREALVDWEQPIECCHSNFTEYGFCWYFRYIHDMWLYNGTFKIALPILFEQRVYNASFHYNELGDRPEGRQQRVQALKNAIEILENKLKQEV